MGVVSGRNSLSFASSLDNSGLKRGSLDAVNIIQNLGSKIASINPWVGLGIAAVAVFGVVAKEAYYLAKNFEHAMKEVETISDATQKNFRKISSAVFELSKTSVDGPEKLAKAYYQIVSAGYDGAKGLKLLEIASKAAVAGVTDTTTAADGLTTVLNAFKIDASESESVADALFNTVKLGKTTFGELASSISQVAPIAAASNIPLNEVLSTIASLTKQGVPTAQAMTQVRSAIIGLNESGRLDGVKTLQENMQALYNTMNGNQTAIQKEVGRIEAVQAILAVSGRNAKSAGKDLLTYNDIAGASEEAFRRMASSNVNQWTILSNRIKSVTEGIGSAVLGMSNAIVGSLNSAFDSFEDLRGASIEQRAEFTKFKLELDGVNTGFERKKEILGLLKETYPGYLKSLDLDNISSKNLSKVLKFLKTDFEDINKLLLRRIELSAYDEDVARAQKTRNEAKKNYNSKKENFKDYLKDIETYAAAPENAIKLSYKFDDSPQEKFTSIEKVLGQGFGFGKKAELVRDLGNALQFLVNTTPALEEATKELEKQKELLSNYEIKIGNENGYKEIIDKIDKIKKVDDLEFFKINFDREEIVEAINLKENTINTLALINSITRAEFKKNPKILAEYLKSENQEIKIASEKRLQILNPQAPKDDRTFTDKLRDKEKQYKDYALAIKNEDKEQTKKLKEEYKIKEEDYITYLQNLYRATTDFNKKNQVAGVLEKQGSKPIIPQRQESVSDLKPITVAVSVRVDNTSINALTKELNELTEKWKQAQTQAERDVLKVKKEAKQEELDDAKGVAKAQENIQKGLSTVSFKELQKRIRSKKQELATKLQDEKKYAKDIIKLTQEISDAQNELGAKVAKTADIFATSFSGASELFGKFGDDETAQRLDQLAGVAGGVAAIASGDIAGGVSAILTSAITVEVVSDTAKFEAKLKELQKDADKLGYAISKAYGKNEITDRRKLIEKQKDIQKESANAIEAEKKARKEVKILGATVSKKGKGSGTDPAKLAELEAKAEAARRKVEELNQEIAEIGTGVSKTTLADSFIQAFEQGKTSLKDFKQTFDGIMRDILLQGILQNYLKDVSGKFAVITGKIIDPKGPGGEEVTANELQDLRNLGLSVWEGLKRRVNLAGEVLESINIDGGVFGQDGNQTGLAGGISKITAEQADVMAGTLNSMRIDVANGLKVAQQSSNYLSQIVQNTSYNHHLEGMSIRLQNIETLLT